MTIFTAVEYPRCIGYATGVVYPDLEDYTKAIELSRKLYEIGRQIGAIDILIASMCINRGVKLKTKDNDFKSILLVDKNFAVEIAK